MFYNTDYIKKTNLTIKQGLIFKTNTLKFGKVAVLYYKTGQLIIFY